jgi:hypothetical protein
MSDDTPGHRPSPADLRAVLAAARHILLAEDGAAHDAIEGADCAGCVATAAISFGFALIATFEGEPIGVSEPLRLRLLAAVDAAEGDLRSGLS